MKRKIINKTIIVSIIFLAICMFKKVYADPEIRPANNTTYWLYLETEINDPNYTYDFSNYPSWIPTYHYHVTLTRDGNPVNESFNCTKSRNIFRNDSCNF